MSRAAKIGLGILGSLAELGRRVRGAPHRVLYFHQVDDPYGHLVTGQNQNAGAEVTNKMMQVAGGTRR
jgi:hypothetical protein